MTEKKIKEIIGIDEWAEVNNTNQFALLMANFHKLSPGVRTKVISKLSNIRALTSMFYDNIADTFISYEPTVIMIFDSLIRIMDYFDEQGGKLTRKDKEFLAEIYRSFSEWYDTDAVIYLQTESFEEMCTADEVYNLLKGVNEGNLDFAYVSMMLMTVERNEFMIQAEKDAMQKYTIDVDLLRDLLGNEPDKDILEKNFKKYIN